MSKAYKLTSVKGFDKKGEPEIQRWPERHLIIHFNFMPPLHTLDDLKDDPYWDNLHDLMTKELGVPVLRDDREVFIVEEPDATLHKRIKTWLEQFWDKHPEAPR